MKKRKQKQKPKKLHQLYDVDQLFEGDAWLQPNRKPYVHVCCDCGSSHDVRLVIVDQHVQVSYRKNRHCTLAARRSNPPPHGVLITHDCYQLIQTMGKHLIKDKARSVRAFGKMLLKESKREAPG